MEGYVLEMFWSQNQGGLESEARKSEGEGNAKGDRSF